MLICVLFSNVLYSGELNLIAHVEKAREVESRLCDRAQRAEAEVRERLQLALCKQHTHSYARTYCATSTHSTQN